MQLWASGFAGPVIAISRHGLLPRTHVPSTPWPLPALTDDERGSVLRLLRRIRREAEAARAEGAAWQDVLDALRPATATLWQRLPLVEQRRFLRHARRWWDVHRHRTAPPIAQQLHGLVQQGYLSVEAGRVTNVETVDGHARVTYRPRGRSGEVHIEAQRVVDATGVAPAGVRRSRRF